jgi:hypothetical protein
MLLSFLRYHHSGYSACRGKSSSTRVHDARDSQKMCALGMSAGGWSRDPEGTTTVFPLRETRGIGQPQVLQNHLAKLRAVGRSKRAMASSPDRQMSWDGSTYIFVACAVPVALRQRKQWQCTNFEVGPLTSKVTAPQRQLPPIVLSVTCAFSKYAPSDRHQPVCLPFEIVLLDLPQKSNRET